MVFDQVESVDELLSKGWLILKKDGILKKVKNVEYGSVEVHFRDGKPYKTTKHIDELI